MMRARYPGVARGAMVVGVIAILPAVAASVLGAQAATRPHAALPTTATAAKRTSAETLARTILAELVAINTTASTGSSTPAAKKLAARFVAAGFPLADVMVMGRGPKSQNVIVRWRGKTRAKPIVFNAHLDVVEAPRLDWATDPFVLTERDGYLYGRGVLDDKGPAASIAAAFIEAKRSGRVPERDLVLALTTGEESDIENGAIWLLEKQRKLVDAEYVVNLDAGGASMRNGKAEAFGIEAAEKVYMDLDMIARGAGGHSSVPPVQTPIDRLARALGNVGQYNFPIAVSPVMRSYLEKRALLTDGETGAAMAALARDPADAAAAATLTKDRRMNSLLRTTCVATILRGGTAPNAIPQEVAANVNCRVLPGTPQDDVIAALRAAVADTTITFVVTNPMHPSGPSMPAPAFTAMIERVLSAEHPGIPVIPYMETGATDGLWFRNAAVPVFGVNGFFIDDADARRMHGKDERISLLAFGELVRYTERLLAEVAAAK